MRRNILPILALGMVLTIAVPTSAQILHNGVGYIPSQYRVYWSQAGLLPANRSGLLPETPTTANHKVLPNWNYTIYPTGYVWNAKSISSKK